MLNEQHNTAAMRDDLNGLTIEGYDGNFLRLHGDCPIINNLVSLLASYRGSTMTLTRPFDILQRNLERDLQEIMSKIVEEMKFSDLVGREI